MGGRLIVSLDFELFWGMLDVCPLEAYQDHVLGGRAAIPELLALFEKYGIHATWAAVGFQMADSAQELAAFLPKERPTYHNPALNPYGTFASIGKNEEEAPCFYAPSLVDRIARTPGQEIGSHTFCHYYCREAGQTPAQFAADMRAAKALGEAHGYHLTSVVLPRNQCEPAYTQILRDLGFRAYRDEENDWIHKRVRPRLLRRMLRLLDVYLPLTGQGGYTPKCENGIWNLTGSRMYKPILHPLECLEGLKLRRIKGQMLHAAKNDLTFHLWWHPHNVGVRTQEHLGQLEELFQYYAQLRSTYGMVSQNMGEAAQQETENAL